MVWWGWWWRNVRPCSLSEDPASPAQPSAAPSTPCYIFRQFHAETLKTPDRTSALHEAFKQNCFNKWFFGSLHANIDLLLVNFKIGTTSIYKQNYSWVRPAWTPQTCAQSGGYLNFPGRRAWKAEVSPTWNFEVGRSGGEAQVWGGSSKPDPAVVHRQTIDTQHGRLCARWCVCRYLLFTQTWWLRGRRPVCCCCSGYHCFDLWNTPPRNVKIVRRTDTRAGRSRAAPVSHRWPQTSNTSASCATSWPGSDPSTVIKLQSEIFGCHKRKIDYLCLN